MSILFGPIMIILAIWAIVGIPLFIVRLIYYLKEQDSAKKGSHIKWMVVWLLGIPLFIFFTFVWRSVKINSVLNEPNGGYVNIKQIGK